MTAKQVTEEFNSLHAQLRSATNDNPDLIEAGIERFPHLLSIIEQLNSISRAFDWHSVSARNRFIPQAAPGFQELLDDYRRRWFSVCSSIAEWKGLVSVWEALGEPDAQPPTLAEFTASHEVLGDTDDDAEFSPKSDFAAELVESIAQYARDRRDDDEVPWFGKVAGAFDWLSQTVGIDLEDIEQRWRAFPVLIVPGHVSDRHGLTEQRSLYAYLTNIRLAHMVRADLAAVAMCRAATEIMLREHYGHDLKTKLGRLIENLISSEDLAWLRRENIGEKVKEANNLLHFNRVDMGGPDRAVTLVREWVKSLQLMIAKAPTAGNP